MNYFLIKGLVDSQIIFKIRELDLNKPEHKHCLQAIEYLSKIYRKERTLAMVAHKIKVRPGLLRDFFIEADRLHAINYKNLKFESKNHFLNPESKTVDDELLIKKIKKLIKKLFSIQKVADSLGLPNKVVRDALFSEYKCSDINELRKKLKLVKKLSQVEVNRLCKVKELYQECLTLEKTAQQLGITRERVRQLLEKGQKHGLFEYEVTREKKFHDLLHSFSREKLVVEIRKHIQPQKICLSLGISYLDFKNLLAHFGIDFNDYRIEAKKGRCLSQYTKIIDELGKDPTTTEMNQRPDWRNLWLRITRLWGSIEKFRLEYGIEKPTFRLHPNTILGWKKAVEQRVLGKKQKKESMFLFIQTNGPVAPREIMAKFNFKSATTSIYLSELLGESRIQRTGIGNKAKYIAMQG